MIITNMKSPRSGRPVANQFIINDVNNHRIVFQSYETKIAEVNTYTNDVKINFDYFDYSRTTSKYFYQFINELDNSIENVGKLKKALNDNHAFYTNRYTFKPVSNSEM